jgi:AmmeMemoRadiSam system protein B
MSNWYPQDKKELATLLNKLLEQKPKIKKQEINGIIVPHAGYFYAGQIAGKAYSYLKNKKNTAIILSPSHYLPLEGAITHNQPSWQTPLGKIKIIKNNFPKKDISQEHALDNQIPFIQSLGFREILPLMIGELTLEEAKFMAKNLAKLNGVFIISTDLSHFLQYESALKKDNETIQAIKNLDSEKLLAIENSACGIFPLIIFIELAKLKGWKPELIEYTNSGDITKERLSVVGYASFVF